MKQNIKNIQELLRLQKLAGIISEDINIVNRILDKISAQGINSLEPEEKEYLEKYSKGEKNIPAPTSGTTTVYTSEPYTELYKIENFPAIPNAQSIDFECNSNKDTCTSQPEVVELLKNKKFELILNKIHNYAMNGDTSMYFHGIDFEGDFSSPIDIAYIYASEDGFLYIVDSLDQFNERSQTEEAWGVESWKKI